MTVPRDPYVVFISAKAVAFAWIGSFLAPFAFVMPRENRMFWICLFGGALALLTIVDGVLALSRGQLLDGVVRAAIPGALVGLGVVMILLEV